jgi:hypothetical protein
MELLLILKNPVNGRPNILVQLLHKHLLLLVFLNSLRDEFKCAIDDVLVQLQLLLFALQIHLLAFNLHWVEVQKSISLLEVGNLRL